MLFHLALKERPPSSAQNRSMHHGTDTPPALNLYFRFPYLPSFRTYFVIHTQHPKTFRHPHFVIRIMNSAVDTRA